MKKILILLTALSLIGCGTIKKDKQQTDIKTEIDSTKKTTSETNTEGSKETKINYKANTFTFTPFDAGTPYFVDGKEYKGGTLVIKNESKDESILEQYKQQVKELSEQITKLESKLEQTTKHKESDNTELFRGIAREFYILIAILFVIYLSYKHFTKPKNIL